jgi:hypothetical protein
VPLVDPSQYFPAPSPEFKRAFTYVAVPAGEGHVYRNLTLLGNVDPAPGAATKVLGYRITPSLRKLYTDLFEHLEGVSFIPFSEVSQNVGTSVFRALEEFVLLTTEAIGKVDDPGADADADGGGGGGGSSRGRGADAGPALIRHRLVGNLLALANDLIPRIREFAAVKFGAAWREIEEMVCVSTPASQPISFVYLCICIFSFSNLHPATHSSAVDRRRRAEHACVVPRAAAAAPAARAARRVPAPPPTARPRLLGRRAAARDQGDALGPGHGSAQDRRCRQRGDARFNRSCAI